MASLFHKSGLSVFNPDKDMPDLAGKVILVTGGNLGLGKESILQLSKHNPTKIYLGARSQKRAEDAIAEIKQTVPDANIAFLEIDLADFESVKKAADAFNAESDRLDILMNNAGIMATPPGLTKQGYEIQFGTNHMGHALLTKLLLPKLEATAATPESDVRIINLSSVAHDWAPKTGLILSEAQTDMSQRSTWQRYGHSKLSNVYFTKALAKRYPSIKSVAVHPGGVQTGLARGPKATYHPWLSGVIDVALRVLTVSVQEGALNQLWAATAVPSDAVKSGSFYYPVAKEFKGREIVRDPVMVEKLWEWTEEELKRHGY